MTQTDRVLAMLRCRGDRGLTAYEFSGPTVIDAGDRIMRVAARIDELKKAGHTIVTDGRRQGHAVYVLQSSAGCGCRGTAAGGGPSAATPSELHLFEPPAPEPLGAYDDHYKAA